ncbi:tRNA(Ile)-lysidine synthase [Jannaschia aquimarina]|uniref:tRNA(Ile)-lysidine synthase n=2 Tax=Jannaschia aquimarina TaxID=935700 RepID=A0A0D1D6C1_9RHOB|nr:tRNA(Ile)-lysidine synthase [Jannaschia aquimarina]SNT34797.1 tRNA(Ile)-lysidine synthase [Jannaschia aquimarina]
MALLVTGIAQGRTLRAVTVDHGLRPEAAEEADQVAAFCDGAEVPHDTLQLHLEDGADLQARARQARYAALTEWARAHDLPVVLLGHTADDVAETLLMRLARGTGIDGLARMPARSGTAPTFVRPFLDLTRQRLRDHLTDLGIGWIEDPSNDDSRFERVRIRQHMQALDLDPLPLARSASALAEASRSLDLRAHDLAQCNLSVDGPDVLMPLDAVRHLLETEREQLRRLLAGAMAWIADRPRGPDLARLLGALEGEDRKWTLAGCLGTRERDALRLTREAGTCPPPELGADIWDRWHIDGPVSPTTSVGALGEDIARTPWRESGLPRASLLATPAIREQGELIAAPLAGMANGYGARLRGAPKPFT